MNMLHILLCSFSAPSEWTILRYASGGQAQGRSLLEDTSSFILAPQGFPNVSTIDQALHNRSDVLQRTIASSRATDPVQSSFEGTGMGRSKSITTVTSAVFIACLGLLTFIVLTWARRHLEQRRARGEHVIDGSEQRRELVQYNESLRRQRIQVLMTQMEHDTTTARGSAISEGTTVQSFIHGSRTIMLGTNCDSSLSENVHLNC